MYLEAAALPQPSRVAHWSGPTFVGVLFTCAWLWLLALAVTFAPPWEWLPLEIELEAPPVIEPVPPPPPPPKPQPRAATPPPKLLTQPALPAAAEPMLPPQPEVAPPEPVAPVVVVESPVVDIPAPPTPVETAPPPLRIEPLTKLTRAPGFARKVEPEYPPVAGSRGEVRVDVRITLDGSGAVHAIDIVTSGGAAFDAAVIDAIRRSTFTPGTIGDMPVATRFNQRYRFQEK